jgi:hypothetical protein
MWQLEARSNRKHKLSECGRNCVYDRRFQFAIFYNRKTPPLNRGGGVGGGMCKEGKRNIENLLFALENRETEGMDE